MLTVVMYMCFIFAFIGLLFMVLGYVLCGLVYVDECGLFLESGYFLSCNLLMFVWDYGRSVYVTVLQNNELEVGYPS